MIGSICQNFIEWNGRYYIIGEGHKFVTNKVTDDDNYIAYNGGSCLKAGAEAIRTEEMLSTYPPCGRTSAEIGAGTEIPSGII